MNKLSIKVLIIEISVTIEGVQRQTKHSEGQHETAKGHVGVLNIHLIPSFGLELLLVHDELVFKIWIGCEEAFKVLSFTLSNVVLFRLLVASFKSRGFLGPKDLDQRSLVLVNASSIFVRFDQMQNCSLRSVDLKEL